MPASIYTGREYQQLEIPIREVIGESGEVEVFPEVQAHGYFDIKFRRNKLVLTAGSFIGQIPLNDRVIIDVQPKVPFGNLVSLVGRSETHLQLLDFYSRAYRGLKEPPKNIFEFLCRCLVVELRWIIREGLYRQYVRRDEPTSMPRGRPLLAESISRRWSKGEFHKVDVSYFQFSADIPENRLIKYTLWYCLNHLRRLGVDNADLVRELSEFYRIFSSVSLDRSRRFFDPVVRNLSSKKIPFIRQYYEPIEKLCLAIIERVGADLVAKGQDYETSSFIVDLADVFEGYIFSLSKQIIKGLDSTHSVLDGNLDGKRHLFSDSEVYEAKPDVVVTRGKETLLIMDAKYKTRIGEGDRYQLISHALSYGAPVAMHVMPGSSDKKGLEYIGTVGTSSPIKVYKYAIDIESEPLDAAEEHYATALGEVLGRTDALCAA